MLVCGCKWLGLWWGCLTVVAAMLVIVVRSCVCSYSEDRTAAVLAWYSLLYRMAATCAFKRPSLCRRGCLGGCYFGDCRSEGSLVLLR